MKTSAMIHSITAEVFQRTEFWVTPKAGCVSGRPKAKFEQDAMCLTDRERKLGEDEKELDPEGGAQNGRIADVDGQPLVLCAVQYG